MSREILPFKVQRSFRWSVHFWVRSPSCTCACSVSMLSSPDRFDTEDTRAMCRPLERHIVFAIGGPALGVVREKLHRAPLQQPDSLRGVCCSRHLWLPVFTGVTWVCFCGFSVCDRCFLTCERVQRVSGRSSGHGHQSPLAQVLTATTPPR